MKYLKDLENQFVEVDGNKITFTIQDGLIPEVGVNGLQASDLIMAIRKIFDALNKDIPCRENSLTITHLDEAWNWQFRRTLDRQQRGVEGTDLL